MEDDVVGEARKGTKKALICVLCVLCLMAIGLGIGIGITVINNNNNKDSGFPDEFSPSEQDVSADEYEQTAEEIAALDARMNAFLADYDNLNSTAKSLLEQNPPDVAQVQMLYDQKTKQYLADKDDYSAYTVLIAGVEMLSSYEYKKEALALITGSDLTAYNIFNREYFYEEAIRLANELGDSQTASDYSARLAEIKEDATSLNEMIVDNAKRNGWEEE